MNRIVNSPGVKRNAALLAVCLGVLLAVAQLAWGAEERLPKPVAIKSDWGDRGDGTFVNHNQLEIDRMSNGEQAGLCHLARDYAAIGILRSDGVRRIVSNDQGKITFGPALPARDVWLRSNFDFDGVSHFAYSTDGKGFTPFGTRNQPTWSYYRGDRIGIYNFNDRADAGHIDVDWFHYKFATSATR